MFCSQCGNAVAEGSRFCSSCGTAVAGPATSRGAGSAGVQGSSPASGSTFGHEANPTLSFDAKRWGRGDRVVAGATFVLFVALFLPWFSVSVGGFGVPELSESALGDDGWMYLVLILSLVIFGYLVARAMSDGTHLPLPHWQALVGVTGFGALLTLICFLTKPSGYTWSYGAYMGLVAALGAVVGAVIRRSEPETLLAGRATATTPVAAVAGPPRAPSPPVVPTPAVDLQTAPPASPAPDARPATSTPVPLATPAPVPPVAGPPADAATAELTEHAECPSCGQANPIRNKFCNACGGALAIGTGRDPGL